MRRIFIKIYSRIILLAMVMCMGFTMSASPRQKIDSAYLRLMRTKKEKSYLKPNFHVTTSPPVKSYVLPNASKLTASVTDDKVLSNVQIYPNPVTDNINIKYSISRSTKVTIKIMDVLGNEVITLYSQVTVPGEWKTGYSLNALGTKLNTGFYFVRVVAGTESVIKRISIL